MRTIHHLGGSQDRRHIANASLVQLLPHADHIIVLSGEGRVVERGSFETLNAADGFVSGLGLKKAMEEAKIADEEVAEHELLEKEAVIAKITSAKALEAKSEENKKAPNSRGKRNADALFAYVRSMGNVWFPVFCLFTLGNVGFRSAQRKP